MATLTRAPAKSADALLPQAVALHQAGRLQDAEALYREILRQQPRQADAQNLLGLVLYQRGDHAAALPAFRRALVLRPGAGEFHRNLGMALRATGQLAEAAAATRRAVQLLPAAPEGHCNLGNILADLGQAEEAVAAYRAALARHPGFLVARQALVRQLIQLARYAEAEEELRQILAARPGDAQALYEQGRVLLALERPEEAEAALQAARAGGLDDARLWLNLGIAQQDLKRWEAAEAAYRAALVRDAGLAEAWFGLSVALQESERKAERLPEIRAALEESLRLRPGYMAACRNLGRVLIDLEDYSAAIALQEELLAKNSDDPEALTVISNVLTELGRQDEALPYAEQAHALEPGSTATRTNLARLLLTNGIYGPGWDLYEFRERDAEDGPHDMGLPQWDGSLLPDEGRVLVWRDQGIGDEVMFCSILPELLAAGHRFTLMCNRRLQPILARALPEARFLPHGPPRPDLLTPDVRAQICMSSLPRLFRRDADSFRNQKPYLSADLVKSWALRSRYAGGTVTVGLSWYTLHPQTGRYRSVPLTAFAPLVEALPGARWVSLQYGEADALREEIAASGLPVLLDEGVHPQSSLEDAFAQISAVDHVVTIDNSVAHMAGAMGKDAHVLLPAVVDYRWGFQKTESVWYPTLRLWRQSRRGEWDVTIQNLAEFAGKNFIP
ncbi:tetratricopeptide repeat protein [Roseomonas sp. GC11]|uniref:tetratricopeptide repeat protein n=1 Tax=Roseomonas sp. GC11 TaxID=2950546 RepID=UPI00210D1DA7|nr:tetratricopeptide repeat protein [Roseomonas sp. GC11]MCQ4159938.1 tetratricopeptide repeat protein [Roseomonas sp. GC11]